MMSTTISYLVLLKFPYTQIGLLPRLPCVPHRERRGPAGPGMMFHLNDLKEPDAAV